jgi:CHASE2 domain-containing sensor protein
MWSCYRYLTSHPHLAGTEADLTQAEYIRDLWKEQGFDRVDIVGYDVLLSYPNETDPNVISLVMCKSDHTVVFIQHASDFSLLRERIIIIIIISASSGGSSGLSEIGVWCPPLHWTPGGPWARPSTWYAPQVRVTTTHYGDDNEQKPH